MLERPSCFLDLIDESVSAAACCTIHRTGKPSVTAARPSAQPPSQKCNEWPFHVKWTVRPLTILLSDRPCQGIALTTQFAFCAMPFAAASVDHQICVDHQIGS